MSRTEEHAGTKSSGGGWRRNLKVAFLTLLYLIPMFWMWTRTDYPDGLGVHIAGHGKAGLIENWWYSYLLVERHHVWDVMLFAYMWLPVVAFLGWVIRTLLHERKERVARAGQEPVS